jgi:hypothetical protein
MYSTSGMEPSSLSNESRDINDSNDSWTEDELRRFRDILREYASIEFAIITQTLRCKRSVNLLVSLSYRSYVPTGASGLDASSRRLPVFAASSFHRARAALAELSVQFFQCYLFLICSVCALFSSRAPCCIAFWCSTSGNIDSAFSKMQSNFPSKSIESIRKQMEQQTGRRARSDQM